MKKLFLAILAMVLMAGVAWADWQSTVIWTMSPGPNLAYEQVLVDGVAATGCDNILPASPKSCIFTHTNKSGQIVSVRSFDDAANSTDYEIGTIGSAPNPASGGSVTTIWVP